MQVDCFITTNRERKYFLEMTKKSLELSGFHAIMVEEKMLQRYFKCEELSKTPIYILIDDDIIPSTQTTLNELVSLMEKHLEISQLGLGWKPNMQDERGSTWCRGDISPDIWEFDHCGGCMAIRKGTIKDLGYACDYKEGIGDDKIMGKVARELGYKVGVAHNLYFHHLGGKYSTVWR